MGLSEKFYLLLICMGISFHTSAQQPIDTLRASAGDYLVLPDTAFIMHNDSTILVPEGYKVKIKTNPYRKTKAFYDSLKDFSYRSRITHELYDLLIKENGNHPSDSVDVVKSEQPFEKYEGMNIARIRFKKMPILEGSVSDTSRQAKSRIGKRLDQWHRNTRDHVLRRFLLFEEGQPLEPYKISDSERLLRQQPFIRDSRIYVHPILPDLEQVEIIVVIQDIFPVGASLRSFGSFTNFDVDLFNKNVLGSGNELRLITQFDQREAPSLGYGIMLRQPNFIWPLLQAEVLFQNSFTYNTASFKSNRDFFAPSVKYGGGIEVSYNWKVDNARVLIDEEDPNYNLTNEFVLGDIWFGRSFHFGKGGRNNLILTGRVFNQHFFERPFTSEDSNFVFHQKIAYLAGPTLIFQRDFFKSRLIFGFGRTEDIPVGYSVQFLGGTMWTDYERLPYLSLRLGAAKLFDRWGYFRSNLQVGGFNDGSSYKQGAFDFRFFYFTPLQQKHRWRFRQFLTTQYTTGLRHSSIIDAKALIRNIRGNENLRGNIRWGSNLEAVFFTPWYFYGFKFALYNFFDFAFISDQRPLVSSENLYYGVGAGLRILNENLAFDTIDISISFFPNGPSGLFGFSLNSINPRALSIGNPGKPEIISFQ